MLKQRRIRKKQAVALYSAIVAQARLPVFYETYDVPDSVDGRFDMISLHCYIMMRRLLAAGDKKLSQALFDVFFKVMEKSLREMGIGDMGIPKHMKRMMKGFNGRANHYEAALKANDVADLESALISNVYGTVESPNNAAVKQLAAYVMASAQMNGIEPEFAPLAAADQKKEKQNA